ncbi:MAG TPA: energy transducer TonB [Candidatus Polarisedimenticolia bacterium]|nr:energy transducer TonB [Candidatus Polarisedimenticolia bacterium]
MMASPFSTPPDRRFRLGLGGAVLVSLALHALLLIWMMVGGAADILLLAPRRAAVAVGQGQKTPDSMQFTFVELPDDRPVAENPRARLLSDKTRVARQPVPTPPGALLTPDPHSLGDSPERRAGGVRSMPGRPSPPPSGAAGGGAVSRHAEGQNPAVEEDPGGDLRVRPDDHGAEDEQEGEQSGGPGESREDRRAAFQKALKDLNSGSYDFSGFDNPGYLQGNNYGTLSFDTKGFDWGDYARQLYLIIKKNWYDRIPIAAYYGQKGKVFIRFVIAKNGSITDLAVIRSSEITPFDKAAENAIRASNPLPPLPSNFPKDAEGVTFGFFYNLPIERD